MDKYTKIIILFLTSTLLASIVTFSILFLLPLVTSGSSPPHRRSAQSKRSLFRQSDEF